MTKIVIIKLGISETLDPEIGRVSSLGDVLRTTPLLYALKERFPDSHITWLVDEAAEPLLRGNNLINRVLIWDQFVPFQLLRERFDVMINLEKVAGICAIADMLNAWMKYGFRFDSEAGIYQAYEKGIECLTYIRDKRRNLENKKYWQQVLVEMIGVQWSDQEYIVGYKSKIEHNFDIGLNHEVGSKWPNKRMPLFLWEEIEGLLKKEGLTVSWQQGKDNLFKYMDWINSCKVIISNDSLGLHLALALGKKVIGLFGPTDPSEVYFYGRGEAVKSHVACPIMPCFDNYCKTGLKCLEGFDLQLIIQKAKQLLQTHDD